MLVFMNPAHQPRRRTMDLLKGRISIPGARYFITMAASPRHIDLAAPPAGARLLEAIAGVCTPPDASLLCATLMPDHLHLLLALGPRLSLARLVAKFKTRSRRILPASVFWQRNFFEHRLRPDESANDYARYIFLNPYRKGLVDRNARWPLWRRGPGADFDFLHQLDADGCPPPAWLDNPPPRPFPIAPPAPLSRLP